MSATDSLYLFSLVSSLCVLFGLNFLLRKGKLVVAKVLGVQFLILGYLVLAAYFLQPENILNTPYFFRTLGPIAYMLPPMNFLFLWYLFHPNKKFQPIQLLFFIPFLVQLLENLPFLLSSKEAKIAEINWMLTQGDFLAYSEKYMWVDPVVHVFAKFGLYLIFFLAMVYYYLRFRRESQHQILFKNGVFHFWVLGLLVFRLVAILYICFFIIFSEDSKNSFQTRDYFLIGEFLFHFIYLALYPKFLDINILAEHLRGDSKEELTAVRDNEELHALAEKIEAYFQTTEVFLNSKLTAELLGSLTGYPHRQIGQAIRIKFGISFRDYLTNCRINHLDQQLTDPTFIQNTTIEAISEATGFGSRQSFYTALKKAKGCTPKEYFNSKLK
jgi:AraC-like DNA-binding protein